MGLGWELKPSHPHGQGFWQIDLPDDPAATVGLVHHVPDDHTGEWVAQHDDGHCIVPECLHFFDSNRDWEAKMIEAWEAYQSGVASGATYDAPQWRAPTRGNFSVVDWQCSKHDLFYVHNVFGESRSANFAQESYQTVRVVSPGAAGTA